MTGDDFKNTLSEILHGYREASREDMLSRARYLADLEKTVTLKGNREKIVRAFEEFMGRLGELT